MSDISRLSRFAARWYAGLALTAGLGILAVCAVSLALSGLVETQFLASPAWGPANAFADSMVASAASMPGLIGVAGLVLLTLLLPAIAAFSYWCLAQSAMRPSGFRLPALLRRLIALTASLRTLYCAALRLVVAVSDGPRLFYPPKRTLASTAAGLSGASPLLE